MTDKEEAFPTSDLQDLERRRFLGAMTTTACVGALTSPGVSATSAERRNRILITTPTGNIGSQVLENILASGAPIRVIERNPSRIPESVRGHIDIVQGSHGDHAVVDAAFSDTDTLFWLCPPDVQATSAMDAYLNFTRPACQAILRHGVRRVVSVSALGRNTPLAAQAGYVTASLAMDDLIASTGVSFHALTMPSFMDNIARQAASIRDHGVFFLPIDADRRLPTVATRDIASAAARLLLNQSWSDQREVALLGSEDLSLNEMADIMTAVLGKTVRYQQISFDDLQAGFVQRGFSSAMASAMIDMYKAKNQGLDNGVQRTPENTTPTTFKQWCEDILAPMILA